MVIVVALAIVLGAMSAGCGGGNGESQGSEQSGDERNVIAAVDVAKPATIGALESIRFTEGGVEAARAALEDGVSGDELWAATWVYATSGTDPTPLTPLLEADDASVRVLAAAALLSLGEPAAFDTLVSEAASKERLKGSIPPLSVGGFADYALTRYTGGSSVPRKGGKRADAWKRWLERNRDSLTFDAESGAWKAAG